MSDVLVLCYHAMSRDWGAGFSATPERLEAQIGSLLERGYEGATFTDAVSGSPGKRTLAVTFDDSYRSVIELAAPVLRRLGVPGTVFVPTSMAGSEQPMSWPGIDNWIGGPHEQELVPMSWEELGELATAGWEIGSHTRTHPRLPALETEDMRTELEGSRADIESHIDGPCTSLAFPYGDFDARVVEATRTAGFTAAGALAGRVRNPGALTWPRVGIYYKDVGLRFRAKASPAVRRFRATELWRVRLLLRRRR
jgi:peptidoglycan/xylan/chitin deacetylase (PgdA/CDA1 family)